MRALDPRLIREVRPAGRYVVLTAAVGVVVGALVVIRAFLLAVVIAAVFDGAAVTSLGGELGLLGGVAAARTVLAWVQERYGERAATSVIAELRRRVLSHAVALGPAYLRSDHRSAVTTLVTAGLEDLRPYLSRYVPQLLLAAVLTPALLLVVAVVDPLSAVLVAVTLPLIPLFMALVGWMTHRSAARRLESMQRLGAQVLDLLVGLPTLVALGREQGPAARVRALGEAHHRATNATLRTTFLSSLVLELLTTLSVALVAVGVGLRLLSGALDLRTALFVLVLAPEVYLPLRQVGSLFHASTAGLAATGQAFAILHRPLPAAGTLPAPDLATATIEVRDVVVRREGRLLRAPDGANLTLRPGTVTAVMGPTGCGKTTLAELVLRLRTVDRGGADGTVDVVDAAGRRTALADIDARSWLARVAWLGQHPVLVPGTIRANAVLFAGDATDGELGVAARTAGFAQVVAGLPLGWSTVLGDGGLGLSAGERQRLALTRVLLGGAALVVLDEPSAHLDAVTEGAVHAAIRALRGAGRTVLLIAHRPSLARVADEVVALRPTSAAATVPREAADGAVALSAASPPSVAS